MDAFTAGTSFIAVQLCVALFMAGTFYTLPEERCTRYWAQSGVLLGVGILIVVINAGAPNYPLLILGNNILIAGLVFQWWGLQAFYRRRPSRLGWVLIAVFFLLYGLLLVIKAKVTDRAALSAMTMLVIFGLDFRELRRNRASPHSFASMLALYSLALLIGSSGFRAVASLWHNPQFLPATASPVGVSVVYLVPLVGTLLLSVALLLLYFEQLVQRKHHLATHDELTALLNRRAVIAAGERDMAVARRLRQPLAVAYIDVDFFKKINDELGHEKGDVVLIELAQVLLQTCRKIDLVGRYGGEEFCVIFPGIGYEGASVAGERLISAVREHRFPGGLSVTISAGLAVLMPDDQNRTWKHLINEADAALYNAKTSGRNRAVVARKDESAVRYFTVAQLRKPAER